MKAVFTPFPLFYVCLFIFRVYKYKRCACGPGDQRTTLVLSNWVFHQNGAFPSMLNQWPEGSSNKPFFMTHFILVRIRSTCHCGQLFTGVLRIQMHILTFAQLSKKKTWEGVITVCYKRLNWFIFFLLYLIASLSVFHHDILTAILIVVPTVIDGLGNVSTVLIS